MGSGDWWNDVRITASSKPRAARPSTNRSRAARSIGGAGFTTHGLAHTSTSATPGSSRRRRGPGGAAQQRDLGSRRGDGADGRTGEQHVAGAVEPGDEDAVGHAASPGLRGDGGRGGPGRRPPCRAGAAPRRAGRGAPPAPRRPPPARVTGRRHQHRPGARRARGADVGADVADDRDVPGRHPEPLRGGQHHARAPACGRRSRRRGRAGTAARRRTGPSRSSTRRFTASTCPGRSSPRAMPDWLVTTPTGIPAARRSASAARAVGTGVTSAGSAAVRDVDDERAVAVEQHGARRTVGRHGRSRCPRPGGGQTRAHPTATHRDGYYPRDSSHGANAGSVQPRHPTPRRSDGRGAQAELLRGQPRALHPVADLLERDVAGVVRRAVVGLLVDRERREAAVVGRAQLLLRDVVGRPDRARRRPPAGSPPAGSAG